MGALIPITLPPQQLPQPTDRLSDAFLREFGTPAGLWMPSKLAKAAADLSGKRNFGTLNGGITTTANSVGVLGQSWKFDGSSGYIDVGSPVDFTKPFSAVGLWRMSSMVNQPRFFCQDDVSHGWALTLNNINQPRFFLRGSASTFVDLKSLTCTSSVWYFLAGVYTGSAILVYAAPLGSSLSSASASGTGTITTTANSCQIGGNNGGVNGGAMLNGSCAACLMVQSALTASQVAALYSSLVYGQPFPLFEPSVRQRFINVGAATSGLLLLRRRAAAA